MNLIDYLRTDVQAIAADTSLLQGARLLSSQATSLLPITEKGALVGMLSAHDIVINAVVAERDLSQLRVADVMSQPNSCAPQDSPEQVTEQLANSGQPGLVVREPEDGTILGVVEMAALLSRSARQARGPEPEYVKRVRGETL